jgi:lipopolysaccharide transport system ATP-binding protein
MSIVLKAENLSKAYQLGEFSTGTLSRDIERWWFRFRGKEDPFLVIGEKNDRTVRSKGNIVWSLKDINFEIGHGEAIGIIGRNGAGKSTLLKILSRVTAPTTGTIKIKGKIASLLEVGTGFHPELTGRDNIYLNGTILGMRKKEIEKKFDQIVDFSGVEKYIDTPVKRYSSGMYIRLAFAVAAHLNAEILIVDEVLAVGDAEFQKKCLNKMSEVSKEGGRTVLFVSHNMAAMQNLCNKIIYLEHGQVVSMGNSNEVISNYLRSSMAKHTTILSERTDRIGNGEIRFQSLELCDETGNIVSSLQSGKNGSIRIYFTRKNNQILKSLNIAIGVNDDMGDRLTVFNNEVTNQQFINVDKDCVQIDIYKLPLAKGQYTLVLYSSVENEIADWIQEAVTLDVEAGDFYGSGRLPLEGQGIFYIKHSLELR